MVNISLCPIEFKWKSNFTKIICDTSKSKSPEHFASRLVKSLFKRVPPNSINSFRVDLDLIGRELNVTKIERKPLGVDIDAVLSPSLTGYKIILNSKMMPFRRRFSCCHEFGHLLIIKYFSKINVRPNLVPIDSEIDFIEEEQLCHKIAAEILLPNEQFCLFAKELEPTVNGIKKLAEEFEASFSATVRRLLELKCWRFDVLHFNTSDGAVIFREKSAEFGLLNEGIVKDLENSLFPFHPYLCYDLLNERLEGRDFEIEEITKNNTALFIWDRK